MEHDRTRPGGGRRRDTSRPPTVRHRDTPLRLVPPLAAAETALVIPDPASPDFEADCLRLAEHARAETRRHAAEAADLASQAADVAGRAVALANEASQAARLAHEVGEMAEQLTTVVLS